MNDERPVTRADLAEIQESVKALTVEMRALRDGVFLKINELQIANVKSEKDSKIASLEARLENAPAMSRVAILWAVGAAILATVGTWILTRVLAR